ncbi:MAG TPA: hypothetical protein VJ761_02215 [Ktedonobacteraceae bacterium]|nr:hypothetical protein [Ktedonobacteraceae bacterium]
MADMIDRDEITRGLLSAGVEPLGWLDEILAANEKGTAEPFVFLPSPQGLVPVLFWTDNLNKAVIQAMKGGEDYGGDH